MKALFVAFALLLSTPALASNDITGNPLVLDTGATTVISTNQFRIHTAIWDCALSCAAADVILLKNAAGAVVLAMTATAANQTFVVPFSSSLMINGLILTTITHGKLYLYYER